MSITQKFEQLLSLFVSDTALHCRWLNTLSMMENVGACKITASHHPLYVDERKLRHAAEETRHAWYLKRQIRKLDEQACATYAPQYLLLPQQSYHYLHKLDWKISRLVRQKLNVSGVELQNLAYLLVTYAIEVEADAVYGAYQRQLKAIDSPVSVRGILAEEEVHLQEMLEMMQQQLPDWQDFAQKCENIQNQLFENWVNTLYQHYFSADADTDTNVALAS